jgi:mannose/fructose/N-acetylgalactosamine-specific phosphotransferase system component IIB
MMRRSRRTKDITFYDDDKAESRSMNERKKTFERRKIPSTSKNTLFSTNIKSSLD